MKTSTTTSHCLEVLALAMIGEGVVGFLRPRHYSLFWSMGPRWLRDTTRSLAEHEEATRLMCAAEIAMGLWLALREIKD